MSQHWRNSKEWHSARNLALELHPYCDICGATSRLQVHHMDDASYHPDERYIQSNLKVLCYKCHFTMLHILYKGGTRRKTTKKDYRRFKALAKYYIKTSYTTR